MAWLGKPGGQDEADSLNFSLTGVSALEPLDMSSLREYRFDKIPQGEAKMISTTLKSELTKVHVPGFKLCCPHLQDRVDSPSPLH